MSVSKSRVRAIFRKELREYRRNGNIIFAKIGRASCRERV